jgi:L-ascorbate metabolism protein UlaG (beta-lactamase superfamily)
MRLQLLRHATVFLEYAGLHFLIDPCLDPKGSQPAILSKRGISRRNNPLQDLPLSDEGSFFQTRRILKAISFA